MRLTNPNRAAHDRNRRNEGHRKLSFDEKIATLGTEATEQNSTAADEDDDASLAQARLGEACEFAGYVEAITQLHMTRERRKALWLMTSKSTARALAFETKVVSSGRDFGSKNERTLREADGETTPRRRLDKNETPDEPGRDGNPSSYLAVGSIT